MGTITEVRDISWRAWGLIAVILAPIISFVFSAGYVVRDHDLIRQELDTRFKLMEMELEAVRVKTNFAYDQATQGKRFTFDDGQKMGERVSRLERATDRIDTKLEFITTAVSEIKDALKQHSQQSQMRK